MKTYRTTVLSLLGAMALGGCTLDFENPNEPTQTDVFATAEGIRTVAVGLQAEYGDQISEPIYVTGLVTEEIGAADATFASYQDVDAGRPIDNNTDVAGSPWRGMYRVVKLANDLLENTPGAAMPAGTKSGIIALAKLYKAMALGNLVQMYEQIPLEVGPLTRDAPFASRATALAEILRLLQEARTEIQQTPPSAEFNTTVRAPGLDLQNTIDAMIARYALIAGDQQLAVAAAQRVNLGVFSELRYSSIDRNPLNNLWYRSGNAYRMRPEQEFRLGAEAGDRRVPLWVRAAAVNGGEGQVLDEFVRYSVETDAIPFYFPDEMRLIQAEVFARTNRLPESRTLVNAVRTQCTPSVAGDPAPCLPALTEAQLGTQAAVLAEILKQRKYELYLQNLRWEDLRRFGAPLKYRWNSYPLAECDLNPSAPC